MKSPFFKDKKFCEGFLDEKKIIVKDTLNDLNSSKTDP